MRKHKGTEMRENQEKALFSFTFCVSVFFFLLQKYPARRFSGRGANIMSAEYWKN
jgi:hypothetical protein